MVDSGNDDLFRSPGTVSLGSPTDEDHLSTERTRIGNAKDIADHGPDQRESFLKNYRRLGRFVAKRDPIAWGIGTLAFFFGAIFVGIDLTYNQGSFIAPLDDVYIHLQYGRELGEGHFFQYNTGDPISTGASSFLYALLLGGAYAIGFRGNLFLPFAVTVGITCFAIAAAGVYAIGRRLISTRVGAWSGLLVAASGPLVWGSASGMEVGLAALLLVASLLAFVREAPSARFILTPFAAALFALARPEGLIFSVALCGGMYAILGDRVRKHRISLASGSRSAGWSSLPLIVGAGQLLFYRLATGTTTANGIQSKSLIYNNPIFYPTEFIDQSLNNLRAFIDIFSGLSTRDYTFPGAAIFFILGIAYLIVARPQWRSFAIIVSIGVSCVLIATSTLSTALEHNLRYVHPFIPIFVLVAVIGIYGLCNAITNARGRRVAATGLLTMALVFSLSALPKWGIRLGQESATIRDTDVSVGAWISGNLPPDAVIGVKDVGAVAYFGDRRVVDVIGLATDGLAKASNNGIGAVYEALRHLPPTQRPNYFAVYEPQPGPPIGPLRDAGLLGNAPLATFDVKAPASSSDGRIVPFTQIGVYRADWANAGTGDYLESRPAGDIRDYLNIGDLDSEGSHAYQPRMALVGVQPISVLKRVSLPNGETVIDSGRYILGTETMTAHNLIPGKPLTITSRTQAIGTRQQVRVVVNGVAVGLWDLYPDSKGWSEASFTVPGDLITGPNVTLEIGSPRPLLSPYPEYTSFGYWFSQ